MLWLKLAFFKELSQNNYTTLVYNMSIARGNVHTHMAVSQSMANIQECQYQWLKQLKKKDFGGCFPS